MERLPGEILVSVLSTVRDELGHKQKFLPVLLTCRTWYMVGRTLLFRDLKLDDQAIDQLGQHLTVVRSHVRTLTIRLDPTPGKDLQDEINTSRPADRDEFCRIVQRNFRDTFTTQLFKLDALLPSFPLLHTFSLTIHESVKRLIFSPGLNSQVLAQIVDSLPATCVNLEIDTAFRNSGGVALEKFGLALQRALPRLKNVRLRVKGISENMLPDPNTDPREACFMPDLETFVMHDECMRPIDWLPAAADFVAAQRNPILIDYHGFPTMFAALKGRLHELVTSGCMPKAKKIMLVEPGTDMSQHWGYDRHWAFKCRDFLTCTTRAIPYDTHQAMSCSRLYYRTYCAIRHSSRADDIFCSWDMAHEVAEGFMWRPTPKGCRMPYGALDQEELLADRNLMTSLGVTTFSEAVDNGIVGADDFHYLMHERAVGQRLIQPLLLDGYSFYGCVQEATPAGWERRRLARPVRTE